MKAALEGLGPGSDARALAHRIASRFGDAHSTGYYITRLREAAADPGAKARVLAAYGAAEGALTRGTARSPGRIFAATWKGYEPPPPPSAIDRPRYHRADRPAEAAAEAPAGAAAAEPAEAPASAADFEPWLSRPPRDPVRRLAAALSRAAGAAGP